MAASIPLSEAPPMNPQYLPAEAPDDIPAWQQTVVAFLAEKQKRSGSRRTVESYARMLWPFLTRVGSPDQVPGARRCMGPWDRRVGPRAFVSDGWGEDRLSFVLLPIPDPDERRHV
jgi:hypothetical protein